MADMIKFFKGLEASLPTSGVNGALYITTDEGAIYLGTGTGMKRLGDFVQVANVAALPEKAHESCLYYCVAENILAKWNGTEWKQINKQPTAEELKTLLGLGSLAYKSEVTEADLNSDLAKKINDASAANHGHDNKDVLDGITSGKVTAWDSAEQNAKTYADGLNTAMNTRVEALEAIDHEHANKALLDTYTQTEANLADAVAKKHSHTFVESELNKIAAGDVAKWNGVVADHLVAADKTELVDSIGDVNTALENYKTSNDEALAGVKATAEAAATKEYTDAELAKKVAKTDYEADKATFATKTDIAKLAGVSEGANKVEASANNGSIKIDGVETVVYTHPDKHSISDVTGLQDALDGKVAQSAYDADKATFATKTELGNVDAKFANYVTSASYATDKSATETALANRYTKEEADGKFALIADAYDDAEVRGLISDNANAIAEIAGDYVKAADIADFETKENVKKVADDLAAYVESNNAAIADRYTKSEADGKFALIADAYDDEEVRGLISDNADAIAAETERATGVEAGLQEQITANANAITTITNGIDPDKIDGLTDLVNWANEHAPEVQSIKDDIDAVEKALADHETLAAKTYETKAEATSKKTEIDGRLDALEGKVDVEKVSTAIADAVKVETDRATGVENGLAGRIQTLENFGFATSNYVDGKVSALKTELQGEIDSDVAAAIEAEVSRANGAYAAKATTYTKEEVDALLTWGTF